MQTWLPSPSFAESAQILDYRRLGKQRVEARQILKALRDDSHGYSNHPMVRAWEGYEIALKVYMDVHILEWEHRNYNNNMEYNYQNLVNLRKAYDYMDEPDWIGGKIHSAHRSNLLEKNEKFYGQYDWEESPSDEKFYPVELMSDK